MLNGVIIKGIGGFYYIKAEDQRIYECKARGVFRKERLIPMVGDYVEIEAHREGKGSLVKIKERNNTLLRPAVANIDGLVIVAAAASPDPNLFLLDKMTVNAEKSGIHPMVCINKTDLGDAGELERIYTQAGFEVLSVCAQTHSGINALKDRIKNQVTAFTGLSGVGKSSILNLMIENEMETGKVSDRIGRGRHTTRHVELLELSEGGFVFDTPGFSSLEITDIKAQELYLYFPEMAAHENECRFRGCSHRKEPDCVIRRLAEAGEIAPSRYESYQVLYDMLKDIKEWQQK